MFRLQTVAGGGADGGDTGHVAADQTQHLHPQLVEARYSCGSWWKHVTAGRLVMHVTAGRLVRHVARDTCLQTDTATRARAAAGSSRANEAARARLFVFTLPSAEPERAEEAICMASLSHDAKNNSQLTPRNNEHVFEI